MLAAFNVVDDRGAPRSRREGVLGHQPSATDLLFVTLKKSEALFCPTTRTRDLTLGPSLVHWESQSTTTASSTIGQWTIPHEARCTRVRLYRWVEACGYGSLAPGYPLAAGGGDPDGVAARLLIDMAAGLVV